MQRWADAAFVQERLLGTVKHNPLFRDYLEGFQDNAYPEHEGGMLLSLHEYLLQEADPMYVSAQVTELWDHARESFQPEPLHGWDLPGQIVFALLPRPVMMTDISDAEIAFRAISWIPVGRGAVEWQQDTEPEGIWFTLWGHIDDNDDYFRDLDDAQRKSWESIGVWSVMFSGFLPFGRLEDFQQMVADDPDHEKEIEMRYTTWLLLQSFWRLSRQLVMTREPLPRQLRRDRRRHYRTEEVTVIQLRRQKHKHDGEPQAVDWKYQWVTRGHWRNQWYPSLKTHRQIWINPFMKGPEDAPIKPVKRAFNFTR